MNRKIPIIKFNEETFNRAGEDDLRLYAIGFNALNMQVNREFETPLVVRRGEEFIIRINHDGVTLEFSKREA